MLSGPVMHRTARPLPVRPGLPTSIKGDEPQFVKDYFDYYKTERAFHARAINSNGAWNPTMALSFINMPLLTYIHEIDNAVLLIHGEMPIRVISARMPSNASRATTRSY